MPCFCPDEAIFVLNKWDTILEEDHRREFLEITKEKLHELWEEIDDNNIFKLAAASFFFKWRNKVSREKQHSLKSTNLNAQLLYLLIRDRTPDINICYISINLDNFLFHREWSDAPDLFESLSPLSETYYIVHKFFSQYTMHDMLWRYSIYKIFSKYFICFEMKPTNLSSKT